MLEIAAKTFIVMLSLLDYAGAPKTVVEDNVCRLSEVARGIATNARDFENLLDLIAVGYVESKFGYRGDYLVSRRGACGVFQQIPKYAYPADFAKPTCDSLQSPDESSFRASMALQEMLGVYGGDRFCHYNAGNICGQQAYRYQSAVFRVRDRVRRSLRRLRHPALTSRAISRFLYTRDWCEILERVIY